MGKVNEKFLDQIICGDVLEMLPQIESESIDLICADPPYNLGKNYGKTIDTKEWHEYEDFTIKWLSECRRVLKSTGSIYVFMGVRFIAKLYLILEDMDFSFNGWITWHYTQGMGRTKGFSPRHEDILYFTKSKDFTFNLDEVRIPQKYYRQRNNMAGANPGDVWSFSHVHYCAEERKPHPTQKPEGAIERIIRASSNEGDTVLDPFLGSGTTTRVAHVLNRHYIGIEINPEYVDLAKRRLSETFLGFDSVDLRTDRRPLDLPEDKKSNNSKEDEAQGILFQHDV
jgi:site-specific DNA-methyltransferase (adenine-specific)